MFVTLDAPDHVSLVAYDNLTSIVQDFLPKPVNARLLVAHASSLQDLLSDQTVAGVSAGGTQSGRAASGSGGT